MSSPIILPFNFQPVAVSVRTASYTIPTGRYARVLVNLEGSATFTIGGVTALRGTQATVLSTNVIRFTNVSGGGQSLNTANQSSANNGAAYTSTTQQETVVAEMWLPAGTVINGTGTWRAVVQEYNVIS